MIFDRVAVLDWSASGKPSRGKDSIWLGVADADGLRAENIATRLAAQAALHTLITDSIARKRRLLIAADFAYAAPVGLAQTLTGQRHALGLWDWLANRVTDTDANQTNYRQVAATANSHFSGDGPFWGNGQKIETPGLPRTKPVHPLGLGEYRAAELAGRQGGLRPKTIWQLAGAGAVGAQSLTGIPMLARLRAAFPGEVAVWPFEDAATTPIVIAEAYLSLLGDAVKREVDRGMFPDQAQVRLHAQAFLALSHSGGLERLFTPDQPRDTLETEGWYLGAGAAQVVQTALPTAAQLTPPRLKNDCFALPQGVDWVPVDIALDRLRGGLHPVADTQIITPNQSLGRVLAAPAMAVRSNPPAPNAAVDGYGFAHATTGKGVQRLSLVAGRAAAGQPYDGVVPGGHAIRILTGAILPQGVDTVVMQEDCATDGATVVFDGPVKPRSNTRNAGEDVAAGAVALPAGHRVRAPDLALLAALGIGTVSVYRPLRVGVLSTGDELLADPGTPSAAHQIYDANRPMLTALIRGWGHDPVDLGTLRDDPATIGAALMQGAAQCDAILTSGGASAGDEDHISTLLRDHGALSTWRVAMKPGRPLVLAQWDGIPVFGLPGNPVAAFVTALVFARPALSALAGEGWTVPRGVMVPAAFSKSKKAGRREYLRARLNTDGHAEVFASEGSGRISGLSWATGLVDLPEPAADIAPGTPVRFISYAEFGI